MRSALRLSERLVARRRRLLGCVLLGLTLLTGLRVALGGTLVEGGFSPSDSESRRTADLLADHFDVTPAGLVAVIGATGDGGRPGVDDPAVAAEAGRVRDRLAADPVVFSVLSSWDTGAATLRSGDGRHALVVATLAGDEAARAEHAADLADELRVDTAAATVGVTGSDVVGAEVGERTAADLLRAELIAFPLILLLLVVFLRGFLPALVPIAIGLLTVVGGLGVVGLLASVTAVTTFSTNIIVGLGLGLSIDYVLLLIARYREELAVTSDRDAALSDAVRVAGRTIAFSAATVAISMLAMALFPIPFLRTMAFAGMTATVLSALFSVLAVPAILGTLGERVLPRAGRAQAAPSAGRAGDAVDGSGHAPSGGFWYGLATAVMRRPVVVTVVAMGALVVLALPVGHIALGNNDDRNLPASSEARQAAEILRTDFDGRQTSPVDVLATGIGPTGVGGDPAAGRTALDEYGARLSRLPGVARVAPARVVGDVAYLSVIPAVEPNSAAGEALVAAIRDLDAPFVTMVGGTAATQVDTNEALISRLPLVGGFIAVVTLVALFLMLGSVLVPLQALLLNVLGLAATFGVLVWLFQDGNLAGALGFTATGSIPAAMPMLVFCVAFGVSMDYSVFLLARIREDFDRTGDPVGSIATGMHHTGRIVTFAALLLATVFAGFVTSSVTGIKLLGTGLTLAVLLDAYVLRTLLVPALMRIAGGANWWAPRPLRQFHGRFGLTEHGGAR